MSQSLTAPSGRIYRLIRQEDRSLQINTPMDIKSSLLWTLVLIILGIGLIAWDYKTILNFFNPDVVTPVYKLKFVGMGIGSIVIGFLFLFGSSHILLSDQGITRSFAIFGYKWSNTTLPFDQVERIGLEKALNEKMQRTNEDVILIYAKEGYELSRLTIDGFANVADRAWFMEQFTPLLIDAGCPADVAHPSEAESDS